MKYVIFIHLFIKHFPKFPFLREKRRKITEKTQQLGNLIPGGPKMNVAEMLNASTKYVKFLQAQVGMLELMNTSEVCNVNFLPKIFIMWVDVMLWNCLILIAFNIINLFLF